jgi:hypothetical protein
MIKTLVAIEVDLASSFAIRYACQLSYSMNMEIHPVYVKFPSLEVPMTGVGWVRRTWEREIVEMGKAEIQEMLVSEMEACPMLQDPRVIYGDREHELLNIMQHETFDLYVEGAPYPFTPATIHKRLHAKFYQRLVCPLIWLRGVRKIHQVLALCLDPGGTGVLVKTLGHLWQGCTIPLHLGYPHVQGAGGGMDLRATAAKAKEELKACGCPVTMEDPFLMVAGGPPLELVKDYGLVAVALEKGVKKDSPELQWLAQVKAPLMLVLYER